MTELIATILITASSVLLFGYWFRYTCLLILNAKTSREFALNFAKANQLGFLQVQSQLRESGADLDQLRGILDRDYDVLKGLLQNSSGDGVSMEQRMLDLNFKIAGAWYSVASKVSASAARKSIEEMSLMVSHFADMMGEQASAGAAA
jgi:hypothetical protein